MARTDREQRAVERLVTMGPMPLAQLARRARNAKTGTAVLQNAAHYLGEAAAALAASYWLGRAQASQHEPSPAMLAQLRNILGRGAAFGSWVGLWRESAAVAGGLSALSDKLANVEPLARLHKALRDNADALGEDGAALASALGRANKRGVLGFFEFLASFRNKIYGHGTMLTETVCRRLALPFMEAVCHVLNQRQVFDGDWLGRSAMDVLRPDEPRYWLRLQGVSERRAAEGDGPAAAEQQDSGLCFVGEHGVTPLRWWVVQDEDATGLSRFGFFQRAAQKRKKTAATFKSIEYLDYLSGRFRQDNGLAALQREAPAWLAETSDASPESEQAPLTDQASADERRFGDFIIESELGRGAMGIVYRARQLSLGRRVALKVLPPAMLSDPVALGRFHREVQALARCDHPNVVRVLTSGVEQSRPWFAMELVEGADLSEVFATLSAWKGKAELRAGHLMAASSSLRDQKSLRADSPSLGASQRKSGERAVPALEAAPQELPEPPSLDDLDDSRQLYQRLAELFAEAADGVEEIHSRGVLHRDIKPANLMLSSDGQRLVVMDLGLAKVSDASVSYTSAGGSDFVGSARYAAPEQLQAKLLKVDHRADIYSLAATLYELCTLTPLYPAEEIPALLQQKLNEDPRPAREIEPAILRDMETILQKALARRPADRYLAAADLAADLRAFSEDRPIQARPPSAFEYLRLFYKRQRRMVALGFAALAMLVAVVVVGFVLVSRERSQAIAERDRASRARDRASSERDRAESLASFIADDVYARLAPIGKLDLLDDVSDRMVEHYASRDRGQPDVALRYAEAVLRAAEVRHLQGKVEEARRGYEKAQQLLEALRSNGDSGNGAGEQRVQVALAQAYHQLAGAHFNQNDLSAALSAAQKALALRAELAEQHPEERAYRRELARSERLMGVVQERRGKQSEALASYRRAVAIGRALVEADPADHAAQAELGRNLLNVGSTLEVMGKLDEALQEYRAGLQALSALAEHEPSNVKVKRQMATSHDSIGRIHRKQKDDEQSLQSYKRALALRMELVRFDPTRAGWQRDLSASYGHVAFIAERRSELAEAQQAYQQSLDISQMLAKRDATNVRWQMDVATIQANLAGVMERQGDLKQARSLLRSSLDTRKRVVARDGSNNEYRYQLALGYGLLAAVLKKQGDLAQAQSHAGEAVVQLRKLSAADAQNIIWRDALIDALSLSAAVLEKRGKRAEANEQRRQALAIIEPIEGADGATVKALREAIARKPKKLAPPAIVQEPIVSRSRKGDTYE